MKKHGFSLVELLVVIAIIAILAALLLPALSGAKNRAAKAVDLSNFRQVMVAVNAYTGDSREVLPWPNWDYGQVMPDGTPRPGWLYAMNPSATGPNAFIGKAGQLWNYQQGGKVLLCPLDRPDGIYASGKGKVEQRAQQLSTYIMNGGDRGAKVLQHFQVEQTVAGNSGVMLGKVAMNAFIESFVACLAGVSVAQALLWLFIPRQRCLKAAIWETLAFAVIAGVVGVIMERFSGSSHQRLWWALVSAGAFLPCSFLGDWLRVRNRL